MATKKKTEQVKMLSPRQYAKQIKRPHSTVATWLQDGRIPQASKLQTPTGYVWEIPSDTPAPEIKQGRPRKDKPAKMEADAPAKPAKRGKR